jgi:hypothetical protein
VLIKHLSTDSMLPSGALTKPLHGAPFKLHTDVLMGRLPLQWISKAKTVVSKEGVWGMLRHSHLDAAPRHCS